MEGGGVMGNIIFHKYTALGNNFIIIDELEKMLINEPDKFYFGQEYSNSDFGIGADGVLFIQSPGTSTFNSIAQRYKNKWERNGTYKRIKKILLDNIFKADAIMRIIEPGGQESSMCGNGIRCVADYLCHKLNKKCVRIITEVNTFRPRLKSVIKTEGLNRYRVIMGTHRRLPAQFKTDLYNKVVKSYSDRTDFLTVKIPTNHSLPPINCYITYTGEPHLVCFTASSPYVREKLGLSENHLSTFFSEKDEVHRNNLLCQIGDFFNLRTSTPDGKKPLFNPQEGININIAELKPNGICIHMRVYERGSWKTTKACGTGAVAITAVAYETGLLSGPRSVVLPEGSIFQSQGSLSSPIYSRKTGALSVSKTDDNQGWVLGGPAENIYFGTVTNWPQRLDKISSLYTSKYNEPQLVNS